MMAEGKPVPMTPVEIQAVNFIEQIWNLTGKFPNKSRLAEKYPEFSLVDSLKKVTFVNALNNRGIDLSAATTDAPPDVLSKEQVAAVSVILDFDDPRSRSAKLRELGITAAKWQGWLKNPKFKAYLHKLSADTFEDSLHAAHEGLLRAVDRGSVDAVKFYLEMTGRYVSNSQETNNIKLILARVMESIQRNVRDPETIRAVAHDFERIMRGEPLVEPIQIEQSI